MIQSEWSPHWTQRGSPKTRMIRCERSPLSTEPWIPSEYLDWIPSEPHDFSNQTTHNELREDPIDHELVSMNRSTRNVSSRQPMVSQFTTLLNILGPPMLRNRAVLPSHDALTIPCIVHQTPILSQTDNVHSLTGIGVTKILL